jgi:hypothetical protein
MSLRMVKSENEQFITMNLREKQHLFVYDIHILLTWLFTNGYEVTFGEAERTKEQQQIHFNNGLTKTLNSLHLKKLALDINIFKDGILLSKKEDFRDIAHFWCSLSPFNDCGYWWDWDFRHFERREHKPVNRVK